jgi:hypothetical protein
MQRPTQLPPELLDSLPAAAPQAVASRRDLRLFNRLLGAERWTREVVLRELRPGERALELGAGDGSLAGSMIRSGLPWDALDLVARPEGWPRTHQWYQGDALTFQASASHQVIIANLFLHHFDARQLSQLGRQLLGGARVIVVNDLQRSRWRQWAFRSLCQIVGAHPVSRHDGVLSIRAGFQGNELPQLLGLSGKDWRCEVSNTLAGAYRLVAVKRS